MEVFLHVLELDPEKSVRDDVRRRWNEFLDVYSLYLKTGIQSVKDEAITKAFEIHLRNPEFTFAL